MLPFLMRLALTTFAVWVATALPTKIACDTFSSLLIAALVLGLLNAMFKPVLMLVSLPILLMTFGLFTLVINSFLLLLVGKLVSGFHVPTWGAAFWGSLVISIVTLLFRGNKVRGTVRINTPQRPPTAPAPNSPDTGSGRVIDV